MGWVSTAGKLLAAGGALAGGLVAGAALEARSPIQRDLQVYTPQPGITALRILHVSDIHMWRGSKWEVEWIRSLPELEPDLVVLTGDNLCEEAGLSLLLHALSALKGIPGAFVFGSNDYYSGVFSMPLKYLGPAGLKIARSLLGRGSHWDEREQTSSKKVRTVPDLPHGQLASFLSEQLGWQDLRNRGAVMRLRPRLSAALPALGELPQQRDLVVSFSGVDDPHISYDQPVQAGECWDEADLRIGVTHAPYARVVDAFAGLGADLVLAGHTHGGQLCLPVGRAVVNNCDAPLAASGGLYRWRVGCVTSPRPHCYRGNLRPLPHREMGAETWLHVSRGLGTSKFTPLRLFCRPETTMLRVAPPRVAKPTGGNPGVN